MSDETEGKQMVVLTIIPGGKRLASLRRVRGVENDEVVFETGQAGRRSTIPSTDCIPIKDGNARTGMGLGVQRMGFSDLGTDDEDAPLHVCRVFDVSPDAPFYLVKGPDKETREQLLDKLQAAVVDKRARFACVPPDYEVIGLPEDQMQKLGWVRAERIAEADSIEGLRDTLGLTDTSSYEDEH